MPTTKMPVWMRSEYVTIGQPPFPWIRGQKLPPVRGPTACRMLATLKDRSFLSPEYHTPRQKAIKRYLCPNPPTCSDLT